MGKGSSNEKKTESRPSRTAANKKRKADRHANRLLKQEELKEIRLELLKKVKELKISNLKRLVGTLNIRRLNDVLNNTYQTAPWFISRQERRTASLSSSNKVTKNNKESTIRQTSRNPKKVHE